MSIEGGTHCATQSYQHFPKICDEIMQFLLLCCATGKGTLLVRWHKVFQMSFDDKNQIYYIDLASEVLKFQLRNLDLQHSRELTMLLQDYQDLGTCCNIRGLTAESGGFYCLSKCQHNNSYKKQQKT